MLKRLYILYILLSLVLNSYSESQKTTRQLHDLYIWQTDSLSHLGSLEYSDYKKLLDDRLLQVTEQKDTSAIMVCLIELADLDRWKGSYEDAFEKLWKAFLLAKDSRDSIIEVRINRNLGITYEVFNQDSLALRYLTKSLKDAKRLHKQNLIDINEVVHGYFSLSSLYRNNREFETAFQYLDSCDISYGDGREMPYAEADRGHMYLMMDKPELAKPKLTRANQILTKKNQRYQVVTLSFMGDLYSQQNQPDSALFYYNQSLKKMAELNAHVEIESELMYKIARLYYSKGQIKRAYHFLEGSRMSADSLFNATTNSNSKLFEIKNKYQETLRQHSNMIKKQQTLIEEERQFRTRLIAGFAIATLIFVLFFLLLQYRFRLKKLKMEQQVENAKNNALLESKNKELTSFALKNLEKEKAVQELLDEIKSTSPKTYSYLKNKHVNSSNKMWEDFNMKFIELNAGFYEHLRLKHPSLTPTEEKHCALIKLNFDSKEMSQILNISLQSVHTSRYRIKRKMNLSPDENLADYINSSF